MEKSVIVTGASGFIGKALTKQLLKNGFKVYAVSSSSDNILYDAQNKENLFNIKLSYEEYYKLPDILQNLQNINNLTKLDRDLNISAWFYLSWKGASNHVVDDLSCQLDNIKYSCEAIKIASELNINKFIFIGSAYKYRTNIVNDICKGSQNNISFNPSSYGIAKNACEEFLKTIAINIGIHYNCINFNNVYGVGDTSNRSTNSLIRQLKQGINPKLIDGSQLYDCIYIDDAVNGIISVADRGLKYKSYYLGSRKLRTFKDTIIELASIVNPNIKLKFGEYKDNAYIDYSKVNLDELYIDTNFKCKSNFRESIIKTSNWLDEFDSNCTKI